MRLHLLVLCLSLSVPALAQDDDTVFHVADSMAPLARYQDEEDIVYKAKNDSSVIHAKTFSSDKLQELREDEDLNYKLPPTVAESLWDRFKMWLSELLFSMFSKTVGTNWGRVVLYTIGIILLIVLIMTVLKVNAFKMLYGNQESKVKHLILDEDIQEMDFEKLLDEAVRRNDYRRGVRLLFLYALKILSDRHLIQLESGKTNHDYVNELNQPELKSGLNDLSFYFDYAWYGNFSISSDTFTRAQGIFQLWKTKLQ